MPCPSPYWRLAGIAGILVFIRAVFAATGRGHLCVNRHQSADHAPYVAGRPGLLSTITKLAGVIQFSFSM